MGLGWWERPTRGKFFIKLGHKYELDVAAYMDENLRGDTSVRAAKGLEAMMDWVGKGESIFICFLRWMKFKKSVGELEVKVK